MIKLLKIAGKCASTLLRDRRGATGMFLGFALIPMVGATGLAVDATLGYMLKSRMSKALDAAGLAAGRVAVDGDPQAVAEQFFTANFGASAYDAELDSFAVTMDDAKEFLTLTAQATMPTRFMALFGHDSMTVAARTVIQRQTTGLELSLVMDITGSMWNPSQNYSSSAFAAMQDAAYELVSIIFGNREEIENLWVSLVPYTATVNIGTQHKNWIKSSDRVWTDPGQYWPSSWKGCVRARSSGRDEGDAPPGTAKFESFFYAATSDKNDNNWPQIKEDWQLHDSQRGPNLGCGDPILPLTAQKSVILQAISDMRPGARGGTTGNLGLSWGWRTISPEWRGLWQDTSPDLPLDYDTPLMDKVVVILTDGKNQFHDNSGSGPKSDYTAYGRVEELGYTDLNKARDELDKRMARTCAAMKLKGITIYAITFGSSADSKAQTLFRNCATTADRYFHAPNNDQLRTVFRTIGGQLSNLRIAE